MKLRIRASTLRLRLTRSEVERLGSGHTVSEVTEFPDGTSLVYALVPEGTSLDVVQNSTPAGTQITVSVPPEAAAGWATSEIVGLFGEDTVDAGPLAVLIEKDFTCVTPRQGEQELDTYPNPAIAN